MKNGKLIGMVAMAALMWVGCESGNDDTKKRALSNAEVKEQMIKTIDSLETELENKNLLPGDLAMGDLIKKYEAFTERYPADLEHTPEYLYKTAALCRAVDLPVKAIKIYDKIIDDFPNWEKAPEVAFLQAFTYDEDLKKPQLAKEQYQEVIDRFPGDQWAVQAEQRLQTVEMSDDELVEFLRKKQEEAAAKEQ
jgi:outer membrane protein assembly factor BamD (BamD/ComL family)